MEVTIQTLTTILEEIEEYIGVDKKIVLKFNNKFIEIEIGICGLSDELDIYSNYKEAYYVYAHNKYQTIRNTFDNSAKDYIKYLINKSGEKKIMIEIEDNNKPILSLQELENYLIGNLLRNEEIKLPKRKTKEIKLKELKELINDVDYLTYSYPFNFYINGERYEVGLCSIDDKIDKHGLYYEHLYIEKNGKVIYLQDPDWINLSEVEEIINRLHIQENDKIELKIKKHFMSGTQYYIPKHKISKEIIQQIKRDNEEINEY